MDPLPSVTPRSRLIVVTQKTADVSGGTQHQVSALLGSSSSSWRVELSDRDEVLQSLGSYSTARETVVFVQEEGRLSPEYFQWATECLAQGALVVEKNVFGLPSAFRPRHHNYLMSIMSRESACRFVLRSAFAKTTCPHRFLLRPNALRTGITPRSGKKDAPHLIRLLRVGRPDARKWSSWECDYSRLLAQRSPEYQFELTLVGAPKSIGHLSQLPRNLRVRQLPYSEQVLNEYGNHDVYIHYSRIGETYGNTLAEAQAAGLFVVFAADSRWDCTPSEFLLRGSSIVATRGWLERHATRVIERIRTHLDQALRRSPAPSLDSVTNGDGSIRILLGHSPECIQPLPSRLEACQELAKLMRRVEGIKVGGFSPTWELLRGWKWERQTAPSPASLT